MTATLGDRRTALAVRCKAASPDAPEWAELFQLMHFLVLKEAQVYVAMMGVGGDIRDLYQAGRMGLVDAVGRFDAGRGNAFSTLAQWHVRNRVQLTAARMGSGMIPPRLRLAARRADPAASPWPVRAGLNGGRITARSIARARACEAREIDGGDMVAPLPTPGVTPAAAVDDDDERAWLESMIASLTPRQAEVIRRRYGLGGREFETLRAIGESLGLTRERVRQVEKEALARLRDLAGA